MSTKFYIASRRKTTLKREYTIVVYVISQRVSKIILTIEGNKRSLHHPCDFQ